MSRAILVIDDNEDVISNFQLYAELNNVRVYYARSGHEGIETWLRCRYDIELVVLDYQLPLGADGRPFDGDAVFLKMRTIDEKAKVVIITGFDYKHALPLLAMENGVLDIIPKGIGYMAIEEMLKRHAPAVFPDVPPPAGSHFTSSPGA